MTENSIVPVPEQAPEQAPEQGELLAPVPEMNTQGVTDLDQEDFKLPIIRIVQSESRNAPEGSQGKFLNSVTNLVKEHMIITILRVGKTRILFPPIFRADSDILCASDDSRVPRNKFVGLTQTAFDNYPQYKIPQSCAECQFKEWGPNNETPCCALSYKYIVVDLEDGMPGILSLKRTDVSMGRALNTLLSTPGLKKIRVSTEFVQKTEGQWFAFRYNVMPDLTPEDWETAQSVAPIASRAVVSADIDAEDMTPTGEASGEPVKPYAPGEFDEGPPLPEGPPPPDDDDVPF